MMAFPKVHDLYIGRVVITTVLATWGVVLGLDLVQAMLITELPDIGTGKYDFVHALIHVIYTAPRRARRATAACSSRSSGTSWA